jgi:hypothetical protein
MISEFVRERRNRFWKGTLVLSRTRSQAKLLPPLIPICVPVFNRASPLAKKTAVQAMSAGCPMRCIDPGLVRGLHHARDRLDRGEFADVIRKRARETHGRTFPAVSLTGRATDSCRCDSGPFGACAIVGRTGLQEQGHISSEQLLLLPNAYEGARKQDMTLSQMGLAGRV